MLLIFATIVIFFSTPAHAFELDCLVGDEDLASQVRRIQCQMDQVAEVINSQNNIVPGVIYHFGLREHMLENVREGTVPQKAWDEYVVGGGVRGLSPARRGLYGTASLDTNDYGGAQDRWLTEIHIKAECRNPENVVTMLNMATSKRFIEWFKKQPPNPNYASVDEFSKKCYRSDGKPNGDYSGFSSPECSDFVNHYFTSSGVKVVHDWIANRAFYIRDRNCINKIFGSPKDMIEIALTRESLWEKACDSSYGLASASYSMKVFAKNILVSLGEVKERIPDSAIDELKKKFSQHGIETRNLDIYKQCADLGKIEAFAERSKKIHYPSDAIRCE